MKKEITVHCIAQTRVNRDEMQSWLDDVGAKEFSSKLPTTRSQFDEECRRPPNGMMLTDAELLVGVAAKRCYNSFEVGLNPNVSKIRTDWAEYLDNVLRSGHGSVCEAASWTWAIEGCTRVFTAEGNRHRAGVGISEASLRYIRFGEGGIPYWEPLSIRQSIYNGPWPSDAVAMDNHNRLEQKKKATRAVFERTFQFVYEQYRELERIWTEELTGDFDGKKKLTSMFRRIVPLGVSVGIVYTLNTRALRHIMTMRCSPAAEEEIAYVFGMIAARMCESEPKLFGDFVEDRGFWRPKYVKV